MDFTMQTLGRHIIMDLWDCDPEILKWKDTVQKIMVDAALEADADIREVTFHQFKPNGVSGIVVIAESHLSIHTFPEHGYASVDVYTCGDMNPHTSMDYLVKHFRAKTNESMEVVRGTKPMRVEVKDLKAIQLKEVSPAQDVFAYADGYRELSIES